MILVEQQPPQGVFICDHAGLVINRISKNEREPRGTTLLYPPVCLLAFFLDRFGDVCVTGDALPDLTGQTRSTGVFDRCGQTR